MADFIEIKTQEEFDNRMKDRLERERKTTEEKVRQEFASQLSELETLKAEKTQWGQKEEEYKKTAKENADSIASMTSQLAAEQSKVKAFQKNELRQKIASEEGLPVTLAGRIQGETEDEMKEDAKALAEVFKANNNKGLPMANLDNGGGNGSQKDKAYKDMLKDLTEGE